MYFIEREKKNYINGVIKWVVNSAVYTERWSDILVKNKLENNMNNMTMYTTFQIWLCLTFHNELMYLQVSGPPYA